VGIDGKQRHVMRRAKALGGALHPSVIIYFIIDGHEYSFISLQRNIPPVTRWPYERDNSMRSLR
jgi:hypothetical protein